MFHKNIKIKPKKYHEVTILLRLRFFSALRARHPRIGGEQRAMKWGVLFHSRKNQVNFWSHHLVLRSLENLFFCKSLGKETYCSRKRRITPVHSTKCKLHCCLMIFSKFDFFIRWSFLKLEVDLSSWESLYLITSWRPNKKINFTLHFKNHIFNYLGVYFTM